MTHERSPDDVRHALAPHGIEVRVLTADTSTAQLAAETLGTTVGNIAKSLLFYADDEPCLVIASGDVRVDPARLATWLGARSVRLARPREALEVTGYRVGGVPPLAHANPVRVLMDRSLLRYATVYAAAGSPTAIFGAEPRRLQELAGAELVDVTE